jgi:diguanylate cyclase (GGDEF)-like protein
MDGARIVAERLRERIAEMHIPGYGAITASLGLASFPRHAASRDLLIVAADRALYESKHSGRNRVSLPSDRSIPFEDLNPELESVETIRNS